MAVIWSSAVMDILPFEGYPNLSREEASKLCQCLLGLRGTALHSLQANFQECRASGCRLRQGQNMIPTLKQQVRFRTAFFKIISQLAQLHLVHVEFPSSNVYQSSHNAHSARDDFQHGLLHVFSSDWCSSGFCRQAYPMQFAS